MRRLPARRAVALVLVLGAMVGALVACEEPDFAFRCENDEECTEGPAQDEAWCVPATHACAFQDFTCPTGYRYGRYVPSEQFKECAPAPPTP